MTPSFDRTFRTGAREGGDLRRDDDDGGVLGADAAWALSCPVWLVTGDRSSVLCGSSSRSSKALLLLLV